MRTPFNKNKILVGGHFVSRTHRFEIASFFLITVLLTTLCFAYGQNAAAQEAQMDLLINNAKSFKVQFIPEVQAATASAQLEKKHTPSYEEIKKEIYTVFGKDGDKAMKLLQSDGKTPACKRGENHDLNTNAENHNHDKNHTTDYGIFQINDHWQGVTNTAFLKDPAINIRMAKNIYDRDGHTFKLWTCGRALGI